MLTRILDNSEALCTFVDQLDLEMTKPQKQHICNMADALLVCDEKKTLAALQRQFIEAPDASNMADFLRISPWSSEQTRESLRASQVKWAISEAEKAGEAPIIYINIDDSLGDKDKQTRKIETVDWFYDHSESSKTKPRYKNSFCYVECTLCIGTIVVTVDLQLYLRSKTVRRINRGRVTGQRIGFRSKTTIARQMLRALKPLLPKDRPIYVQFDSWYASARLIKYVRRQGWHVTCGLKFNRTLNGIRIDQLAAKLRHQRYKQIQVTATDKGKSTYFLRQTEGRLSDIKHPVRVFFSKRHPRDKSQAYFMCTDLTRSAQQALQGYHWRWSCEVLNFYLKTQLGLADFRVQSFQAVDKYMVVVWLAWAYVERRFYLERSPQIKTYGDLIRRHRDEHAITWLTGAIDLAIETGDPDLVVQRFLRLQPQPA